MKTIFSFPGTKFVAMGALIAMFFSVNPLFSQDSIQKPHEKKQIRVVVKTDVNGNAREIDTTINLNGKMDEARLKKVMKEFDINLEDLGDNMQDMVVDIDAMNLPDSSRIDSLCKMVKKFRINVDDGKGYMGRRGRAHAYTFGYNFDEPGLPDVPPPPPPPPTDEDFGIFEGDPGFEPWTNHFDKKGNTLSDIIGDIPMDRVKSYSIKDTRNGKKIVIELNNDPIIEHRDKVIILREPSSNGSFEHSKNPRMKKRIIIRSDGDDKDYGKEKM